MKPRKLYPMQLLCEAVAQQLHGNLPQGEAWHRDLIEQMTLDLAAVMDRCYAI